MSVGAGRNMLSAVTGSHFVLGLKGIGRPKRSKEVWWRMPIEQVWAFLTPHVHPHPMPLWSLTCAKIVWFLPTSSAVLEVRSLTSLHPLLLSLQNAVDTIFSLLEGRLKAVVSAKCFKPSHQLYSGEAYSGKNKSKH